MVADYFNVSMNYLTLHSNLVIFKLSYTPHIRTVKVLYIPIWLYSNPEEAILSLRVDNFTFQSGYIQIELFQCSILFISQLYIPIWLYSNWGHP